MFVGKGCSLTAGLLLVSALATNIAADSPLGATAGLPVSEVFFDADRVDAIDALLQQRMVSAHVPGVAVALVENGRVSTRAYGVVKAGGPSVTGATRFSTGSVTKSFTAATVQSLSESGSFELSDSIRPYIDGVAAITDDSRRSSITIANLLNHTSGYSTHSGNTNQAESSTGAGVLGESARRLLMIGPDLPADFGWQYSNANYQMLGALIETTTGVPFANVLAERVFTPSGLNTAAVLGARVDSDAVGHQFVFGQRVETRTTPGGVIAAQGGVIASADDLGKYLQWQMNRFPPSTWQTRYDRGAVVGGDVRYSHGWFMQPSDAGLIVYHDGNNAGFTAAAAFNPFARTGVVVLANASSGYVSNDVDALTVGLRQLAMNTDVRGVKSFASANAQVAGLTLLVAVVSFWMIRLLRNPERRAHSWAAVLLPSAGLLALAWLLAVALPQSFGATLSATRLFFPDAGWVLTIAAVGCALLALLRIVLFVVKPSRDERA